jgi:hypothetical protein
MVLAKLGARMTTQKTGAVKRRLFLQWVQFTAGSKEAGVMAKMKLSDFGRKAGAYTRPLFGST